MPPRRTPKPAPPIDILLDWHEVQRRTTLGRTTVWRLQRAGRFPRPLKLSPSRIAWRESDITAWMAQRQLNTGAYVG